MNRWTTSNKAVYNVGYHIIWCPKYRRRVLVGEIAERFRQLALEKASEIEISIEQMEVMEDHVHLFVKAKPTYAPHWIVQQLKGYTSKIMREEFPSLRSRLPTLWTRSYYLETVGNISGDTVKKYIQGQKNK